MVFISSWLTFWSDDDETYDFKVDDDDYEEENNEEDDDGVVREVGLEDGALLPLLGVGL